MNVRFHCLQNGTPPVQTRSFLTTPPLPAHTLPCSPHSAGATPRAPSPRPFYRRLPSTADPPPETPALAPAHPPDRAPAESRSRVPARRPCASPPAAPLSVSGVALFCLFSSFTSLRARGGNKAAGKLIQAVIPALLNQICLRGGPPSLRSWLERRSFIPLCPSGIYRIQTYAHVPNSHLSPIPVNLTP